MKIVLGSTSKSRNALFEKALPEGFSLIQERLNPDIDEKAIRRSDPNELVLAIANAKADALIDQAKELADFLLTADSVIVFNGQVREKPIDAEEAKVFLQSYGTTGYPAICTTGLVVVNLKTGTRHSDVDVSYQYFDCVPDEVANALIEKGEILFCAGGFILEDELLRPYIGQRTGEEEAVKGMPIATTRRLIQEASSAV
eukprot:CFRG2240T1